MAPSDWRGSAAVYQPSITYGSCHGGTRREVRVGMAASVSVLMNQGLLTLVLLKPPANPRLKREFPNLSSMLTYLPQRPRSKKVTSTLW